MSTGDKPFVIFGFDLSPCPRFNAVWQFKLIVECESGQNLGRFVGLFAKRRCKALTKTRPGFASWKVAGHDPGSFFRPCTNPTLRHKIAPGDSGVVSIGGHNGWGGCGVN